jgi:hypothetical protein
MAIPIMPLFFEGAIKHNIYFSIQIFLTLWVGSSPLLHTQSSSSRTGKKS